MAVITLNKDDGTITLNKEAPDGFKPNDEQAAAIKADCQGRKWPKLKPVDSLRTPGKLPAEVEEAEREHRLFKFYDQQGKIVMLQVRNKKEKGDKKYEPWTYWDDDQWFNCENDEGLLPLWGIEQLADKGKTTVFLHEGAKAARAMAELFDPNAIRSIKDEAARHPWAEELSRSWAAHLGWIGGAPNPHRTDWSVLNKAGVTEVIIVSDNDELGVQAVPHIAKALRCPTYNIKFTNEWKPGFDLADKFPDEMFRTIDGERRYTGFPFTACLHPATWATNSVPNKNKKGKPSSKLRKSFAEQWGWVEKTNQIVNLFLPHLKYDHQIFNNKVSPFSHSDNTAKLIIKEYSGHSLKLAYRPDKPKNKIITDDDQKAINCFRPTTVKPKPGNAGPFLAYLDYMFPNEIERHHVKRWIATLVARPEIRMEFGLLLISEAQGTGKNTLCEVIVAPLVGKHNVSFPSGSALSSDYNTWMAEKRLVVVSEVYEGHSWKVYNTLKSAVTDQNFYVNEKFQPQYNLENWSHFILCSNSRKALKVDMGDRRWFYPEVTEKPWPRGKFVELREWAEAGGLSIIYQWALDFGGEYIGRGERPPTTDQKQELIERSKSAHRQMAADIAEMLADRKNEKGIEPAALVWKDVRSYINTQVREKSFEDDVDLRDEMEKYGAVVFKKNIEQEGKPPKLQAHRLCINKHPKDYIIMNAALAKEIEGKDDSTIKNIFEKHFKTVGAICDV